MISLRLSADLERKLNQVSRDEHISKTEVIKRALIKYFNDYKESQSPYALGKDLFGKHGSGNGKLSINYKKLLKEKFSEKHSH